MRKGVAMFLRERPGFSTLRSVQVPQELFFEEFDFLERFRNNAWVVLLVTPVTLKGLCMLFASRRVSLHTEFCIDMAGWTCIYMSCWPVYIS